MSYTEYLRRKAAGATVILDTQKPTDASMFTMKKRYEASSIFRPDGTQVGSTVSGKDRSGNDHQPLAFVKATGRPQSASDYTAFRGSQGIRDDAAYMRGRIEQTPEIRVRDPDFLPLGMASNGTRFVAVGRYYGFTVGRPTIYYSDDGITWLPASGGFFDYGVNVIADPLNPTNWVAVGKFQSSSNTSVKYSTDNGVTWSNMTSSYFADIGYDVTADSAGNWILVGDDNSGANTIKIFTSFSNITTGTVGTDGVVDMFTQVGRSVATDGTTTVAVGRGGTTIMYASNSDLTSWTRVVAGNFGYEGYGVTTDGAGNWVMVGDDDDGPNTIKTMVSSDLTTVNNIAGNQFLIYGTDVAYDASTNRWVLTGWGYPNNDSIKTAVGISNVQSGTFEPVTGQFVYKTSEFPNIGQTVISNGSGLWVAGGLDTITLKRSTNGRDWSPESLNYEYCPCVPELGPAPKSSSDILRDRLACIESRGQAHDANELGPALFVDNTIRLKNLTGCCDNDITKAIHEHPALIPRASWSPRPDKGAGGIPVYTVASPSDARKVGNFHPRKFAYIERKHGNDLNVNPRRVPGPYKLNTGIPHLKINDPFPRGCEGCGRSGGGQSCSCPNPLTYARIANGVIPGVPTQMAPYNQSTLACLNDILTITYTEDGEAGSVITFVVVTNVAIQFQTQLNSGLLVPITPSGSGPYTYTLNNVTLAQNDVFRMILTVTDCAFNSAILTYTIQ